jgi:omega-6 fatty acid desaturase (delta-12 desaturase)
MSVTTAREFSLRPRNNGDKGKAPIVTLSEITEVSSSEEEDGILKDDYGTLLDTNGNVFKLPDYSIQQIRDAIPAHCYKRSALHGYSYVMRDISLLAITFYIFNTYVTPGNIPSYALRFTLWSVYGFLQGLFGTGLWVLAHECGHQAFSSSKVVNDFTGWVLHSALLVPYFSWKISHGKHHKATGHMERDMVFIPKTRGEYGRDVIRRAIHDVAEVTEETPALTLIRIVGRQLLGWPIYLMTNNSGHDFHDRQSEGRGTGKKNGFAHGVNHFNPGSPIFDSREARLILLSDLGLLLTGTALYFLSQSYGVSNILLWYFLPYLWVNNWLVAITYLQHTDPTLAHYTADEWTYVRGAASTIDRDFGFIGRHCFHGIIETHVLHHYVSTIPFYNAYEATEAVKKVMGQHYRADTEGGAWGFIRGMWTNMRLCQWVEHSQDAGEAGKGVLFYRNRNGLGVKPLEGSL